MNIFERASRLNLTFQGDKGVITDRDLWRFSPEKLNELYQRYSAIVKAQSQDSLFTSANVNDVDQLRLDIIKYIFDAKQAEANQARDRADKLAQKQLLLEMVAIKQRDALASAPVEELLKKIEALGV